MYGSQLLADPGGILIWAALTAFVAGLMRGFAGFGSAMLMAPIFAVLMTPAHMVPIVVSLELPMGALLFIGARKNVEWASWHRSRGLPFWRCRSASGSW